MAGAWLASFARALTTAQAFEQMVAPAIADLQHEAHVRRGVSWRGYGAVWLTLAVAISQDFHHDARTTLDLQTVHRMLRVSAWIVLLFVLAPRLWAMAEIGFDRRAELAFSLATIPSAMVTVLPVLMLPLASVIARRGHGRTVLLVAAATALLAFGFQTMVVPVVDRAWAAPAIRAVLGSGPDGIRPELAVRETVEDYVSSGITGQPFGPVFLDEPYPERRQVSRAHRTGAIAAALAFALCGYALRPRRDWAIVAVTLPFHLVWVWLSVFAIVWTSGLGFHPVLRGWLPTLVMFAIGTAAMTVRLALDHHTLVTRTRS